MLTLDHQSVITKRQYAAALFIVRTLRQMVHLEQIF